MLNNERKRLKYLTKKGHKNLSKSERNEWLELRFKVNDNLFSWIVGFCCGTSICFVATLFIALCVIAKL